MQQDLKREIWMHTCMLLIDGTLTLATGLSSVQVIQFVGQQAADQPEPACMKVIPLGGT
jgi:hypothetical protein